jgi:uncharacterized cupin superfamily protein
MIPEAPLEETGNGLVPAREGWFVLNAREGRWLHREGRGERLTFEGETRFPQFGLSLYVLDAGQPIGMYHWEAGQEDFLILSGEALLIVEGEERPLRAWDFVHLPPETRHMIVATGDTPCVLVGVGARGHTVDGLWGRYAVDEVALRHGAGVEQETSKPSEAYARFSDPEPMRYREGWLPG